MKLSKSTTILLNVILVLIIALLVKSAIASPKHAYAQGSTYSYKLASVGPTQEEILQTGRPTPNITQVEEKLNAFARDGWKLHSISLLGGAVAILERSN
jgi:ABC-type uncharacterized transport system permease subunit